MISSSLHPGDFLAVLAVLSVVACVGLILLIWKRRELVSLLKRWDGAEFWLAFVEGLGAFSAGAVAAAFKVWELDAWRQHPVRTPYAFRFAVGMTFLVIYAKWARDRVKERDKEKVRELTDALSRVSLRLDRFRRLGAQIRGLIQRKIQRVREVAKKANPTVQDLIIPEERATQVHTIIKAIFDFFHFELQQKKPGGRMRIGLYHPDELHTRLVLAYSFDGQKSDCFHENPDWMQLNSPQGIRSEVVRAYHADGDHRLQLIPDCHSHSNFEWFRHEQRSYLSSMLTFKYQLQIDGVASALIVSIDCDEPNFFGPDRYEEISEFLVEMLQRFEYEMLGLEIVAKLPP